MIAASFFSLHIRVPVRPSLPEKIASLLIATDTFLGFERTANKKRRSPYGNLLFVVSKSFRWED